MDLSRLSECLDQVALRLPEATHCAPAVSAWSIGQHIEHVLRATSAFTLVILRNRKPNGHGIQREIKHQLLEKGQMPRGLAQAPEATLPGKDASREDLAKLLLKTRKRVDQLVSVDADAVADHPYLGEMNRDEIIRFMEIHLEHHLRIMDEIAA